MRAFTFLFFLLCIAYSQSANVRTAKEIHIYKNFLKNSVHGIPQVPVTPKMKEVQPEWERSGKFEGDILLTDDDINMLVDTYSGAKNALTNVNKLWPNKVVVYEIDKTQFTPDQVKAITNSISNITKLSCVTFKEKTKSDMNYISGKSGGCYASVGYSGTGAQSLNLQPNTPGLGCFRLGTIVHEFLHGIGFYHEQSTYDRDDYVKIVWEKIQPGTEHNFNKYTTYQVTNLETPYDYGSVLHYSEYGFSIDGSKTIVPLKTTSETIGQRLRMSEKDIIKLNRLYKCPGY